MIAFDGERSNIEVLDTADSVAQRAAEIIAAEARAAVAARGRFVMAVSGGHTPWVMLRALANADVPWPAVHIVQVDERVAPAGHPDRNLTHLARKSSRSCAAAGPSRSTPCRSSPPISETAAAQYAATLRRDRRIAAGARPGPPGPWS